MSEFRGVRLSRLLLILHLHRGLRVAEYKGEAHEIDATLEVVNAVTDLLEAA